MIHTYQNVLTLLIIELTVTKGLSLSRYSITFCSTYLPIEYIFILMNILYFFSQYLLTVLNINLKNIETYLHILKFFFFLKCKYRIDEFNKQIEQYYDDIYHIRLCTCVVVYT